MEFNAISAGNGSLINSSEIKILICYILDSVKEEVPGQQLASLLNFECIANYFEVLKAIDELLKTGNIAKGSGEDTYIITKDGSSVAETLKTSLPLSIKEKAYASTVKMISRLKNSKDTKIDIVKENGICYITCTASEGDRVLMSIKIMVGDDNQAQYIKERFIDDPASIYTKIVDFLTFKEEK